MDRRATGQALRLAGPLLQIIALIGLFRPGPDRGLRTLCYAGFFLGFVLVLAGVALVRLPTGGPVSSKGHDLDLDR